MTIDHKKTFESALWRTATERTLDAARRPAIRAIVARTGNSEQKVAAFLDSREGTALLAYALGVAIPQIPQLASPKWLRLSRELRVLGAKQLTDLAAEQFVDPLIKALEEVAGELPELPSAES